MLVIFRMVLQIKENRHGRTDARKWPSPASTPPPLAQVGFLHRPSPPCHSECNEESLCHNRFFAALRMTGDERVLQKTYLYKPKWLLRASVLFHHAASPRSEQLERGIWPSRSRVWPAWIWAGVISRLYACINGCRFWQRIWPAWQGTGAAWIIVPNYVVSASR